MSHSVELACAVGTLGKTELSLNEPSHWKDRAKSEGSVYTGLQKTNLVFFIAETGSRVVWSMRSLNYLK
eukprot:6489630-Amphidinium_carterae.1